MDWCEDDENKMMKNCKMEYNMMMMDSKHEEEYKKKLSWYAMVKRINELIKGVNEGNVRGTIDELLSFDLGWGRGPFCKALLRAQSASPDLTPLYAALIAGVNPFFPQVGDLMLNRLFFPFFKVYCWGKRDSVKQDDVVVVVRFLAHLANQRVGHPRIVNELFDFLIEDLSRDFEVAVCLFTEYASLFRHYTPEGLLGSLISSDWYVVDKDTVKDLVQELFVIRNKYQDSEIVRPELDVGFEDQITHEASIYNGADPEDELDDFPAQS